MAGFIAKQPNGLYCRFSTVVDCPTHVNMTAEQYIEVRRKIALEEAECEARKVLKYYVKNFSHIEFNPHGEMTRAEFNKFVEKANDPKGVFEEL